MELTTIYRGILQSLGLHVDDKGFVSMQLTPDDLTPYCIQSLRLIVPEYEFLKNPDWNKFVAFHPLSENIARKDSVVFKNLQRMINASVDATISILMREMIAICADTDRQKTLNHIQSKVLEHFTDADEKSFKNFESVERVIGKGNKFVTFSTLRGKKLNGEQYSRVCFVTFHAIEQLEKALETKQYALFGVKLRQKDVKGYLNLFKFIFHHLEQSPSYYSTGTLEMIAPSFQALINSYAKVTKSLEEGYRLLKLPFDSTEWTKHLDKLSSMKGNIPPLPHNEGDVIEGSNAGNQGIEIKTSTPTKPVTPSAVAQLSNSQPAPYTAPAVQPQPVVQQQQQYMQPQTQPQYQQPQPVQWNQPVAPQNTATTEVVERDGKKYAKYVPSPAVANVGNPYGYGNPAMNYNQVIRPVAQPTSTYIQPAYNAGYAQPMNNRPVGYGYNQPSIAVNSYGNAIQVDNYGRPIMQQPNYNTGYNQNYAPAGMTGNQILGQRY